MKPLGYFVFFAFLAAMTELSVWFRGGGRWIGFGFLAACIANGCAFWLSAYL